jgi:hypothetical protein
VDVMTVRPLDRSLLHFDFCASVLEV